MLKPAENEKTTMIEVVSFLFFTLFAMILAFFTSAKAFAGPTDGLCCAQSAPGGALIAPCTSDESVQASVAFPWLTGGGQPHP